ncbi:MAG TPA: TolC family protein [Polyangiaceae bacterium]|jgi:cobalt-zinc-cadmium efflux system outer membrane protein|nr:TolC family protein [Polyangiaceae bacterium]
MKTTSGSNQRLFATLFATCAASAMAYVPEARAQETTALLGPSKEQDSDAAPASEDRVFDAWLQRGRELASLRTKIGAAQFDVATAALWPNPSLTVSGGVLLSGPNLNGASSIGPQLTVPVPVFGQIGMRRDEAVANLRVAEVEVLAEVWDRAGDVQDAMLERAFSEAEVEEVQGNLTELARISNVVSTRAAAGANSVYDKLRVSTAEATFRAALATAQTGRDRAEAKLLSLVAVPALSSAPVTREGLLGFRGPESETALQAIARKRRPDLELARRGVLAAHASAARYRREIAPIPSVSFGPYFTQGPASVSLQASISVPLPAFDRNQGLIGRALVQADGQQALAEAIDQRIGIEVHGAWQAREQARAALVAFQEGGLKATDDLLARAEISYQAGTFAILDLLDAYRAVWDARVQALGLERAFAQAEAELEHAAVLLPINQPRAVNSR